METEILITNDDGVQSPALEELERELAGLGTVTIVAPDRESSAASQAITLNRPLRYHQIRENCYAVDGTPSDCVILASLRILKRKPSLVVSGINRGANVGDDVLYSGTVAGAFEGALQGIPAIAVSMERGGAEDFTQAARFTALVVQKVLEEGLPEEMVLNVNFPERWNGGVRFTRQGRKSGKTVLVENLDPRGREYFWLHEELHEDREVALEEPITDYQALEEGCVSITPLQLDRTAYRFLKTFAKWPDLLGTSSSLK